MKHAPVQTMLGMTALALVILSCVFVLALGQPWLGAGLAQDPAGRGLLVTRVAPAGPAAGALQPGDVLTGMTGASGAAGATTLALHPRDRIEEPDILPTTAEMAAFFADQGRISALLHGARAQGAAPLTLQVLRGADSLSVPVVPAGHRPLTDLPAVFWSQILVGLVGVVLGGWVLALRGWQPGPVFLALAGAGISLSASMAALYSTRELALPETVFARASSLNTLGSLTFGIGMIGLFLTYPRRYLPRWAVAGVIGVFCVWAMLAVSRALTSTALVIHVPVLVEMIVILLAVIGQVIATRGDPHARAAMRWFGLSVSLGAGGFVGTIALPQAVGLAPQLSQGHAFTLFLVVYIGLALGVARYRLFELERWAYAILFYAGGVALLLALDALLIWAVALDKVPAFSLSLIAVALLYLPLRDRMGRWLSRTPRLRTEELFDRIGSVILSTHGESQSARMRALLTDLFQPLHIAEAPGPVPVARLLDGGAVLEVPGVDQAPPLRLHWARRGKRLFSTRDVERVRQILQMMTQAVERLRAYEAGAEEERRRINRDMHDNIGVQLLGALHSADARRKDALIRQTLTDLREIVSSPGGDAVVLRDLLGDMRAELSEHLASAEIALEWEMAPMGPDRIAPHVANSIRAILREGAGNVLRHSGARHVRVQIGVALDGPGGRLDQVILELTDDGRGPQVMAPGTVAPRGSGNGLRNLRQRTEARGGRFSFGAGPGGQGARLRAVLIDEPAGGDRVGLRDAGE